MSQSRTRRLRVNAISGGGGEKGRPQVIRNDDASGYTEVPIDRKMVFYEKAKVWSCVEGNRGIRGLDLKIMLHWVHFSVKKKYNIFLESLWLEFATESRDF